MGSSQCRDQNWVSGIAGRFFIIWATREALIKLRNYEKSLIIISLIFHSVQCHQSHFLLMCNWLICLHITEIVLVSFRNIRKYWRAEAKRINHLGDNHHQHFGERLQISFNVPILYTKLSLHSLRNFTTCSENFCEYPYFNINIFIQKIFSNFLLCFWLWSIIHWWVSWYIHLSIQLWEFLQGKSLNKKLLNCRPCIYLSFP